MRKLALRPPLLLIPGLILLAACTTSGRLVLPEPRCTGAEVRSCLPAQSELDAMAVDSCQSAAKTVCLAPIGQVSADLVRQLVDRYRAEYDLEVRVLTPQAIPTDIVASVGEQYDANVLLDHLASVFPDMFTDSDDVVIGLTPVDLYDSTSHFRYVFGIRGTVQDPKGIVSTSRMGPEVYRQRPNDAVTFERTWKLVSKYIGLFYYVLEPSDDPDSAVYDNILGPDDLDEMDDRLDVPGRD